MADPALIKTEIQHKYMEISHLYGIHPTVKDHEGKPPKFTQGDYRRFCALFYLQTRRLLKETEFLMAREKRKRMMPRHLLTAAVISGTIPNNLVAGDGQLAFEEVKKLEVMMTPKRPQPARSKSEAQPKPSQPRAKPVTTERQRKSQEE